jgi:UDP-N-acetylmuramoylalanine--D-glutamate ligase
VAEINGVEFLNNSMCTNMLAGIRSLEAVGRPAIVIAGGKGKGMDYAPLAEAFARHAKHIVLIGADAPLIEEAARNAGFTRLSRALTMAEAVELAWRHAQSGDTVVLSPACASFDMFKNFEHRGQVFKAAVRALVERVEAKS